MLTIKNLNKGVHLNGAYKLIINDISANIEAGEFLAVTGRSGSGKTTLLHLLSTLTRPDDGEIAYNGMNLLSISEKERNRLLQNEFSMIFQFHHLFPYLTVLENCLVSSMRSIKPVAKSQIKKARECLMRVGLEDRQNQLPGKLSGGEQQRVAIARALTQSSKVLFADEPTGSLDKKTGEEIMTLLHSLNAEGVTIIMVTHNPEYSQSCHRALVLEDGRLVQ